MWHSKKKLFDESWVEIKKCTHYSMLKVSEFLVSEVTNEQHTNEQEWQVIRFGRIAKMLNDKNIMSYNQASEMIKRIKAKRNAN